MSQGVYESLRDDIVNKILTHGTALVQEQIAEQFGTSRTPVRDALNRLAHEGLVAWNPGNGYAVTELRDETIVHVFQVRERLETLALRLACGKLKPLDVARLRMLIEEMDAADPSDAAHQYELNRRFHQGMVEPCDNPLMLSILDDLWGHPASRQITRAYIHDRANVVKMIDEHSALLEASVASDVELLIHLSGEHIAAGYGDARSETSTS